MGTWINLVAFTDPFGSSTGSGSGTGSGNGFNNHLDLTKKSFLYRNITFTSS